MPYIDTRSRVCQRLTAGPLPPKPAGVWRRWLGVVLVLSLGTRASRAAEPIPGAVERERCGQPVCHNSVQPWSGTGVRLDEFRVWRDADAHHRSFATLDAPRSRAIAARLGGPPATEREDCLACHATAGPSPRDVGCETCHGSGTWVEAHSAPGARHADNVRAGLRPLDDPVERAALCVGCHLGAGPPTALGHRLLAAGHPRLAFELDSLSADQPAHYRTADYPARGKHASSAMQLWAVGEGVALSRQLARIARVSDDAYWPELAVYDCSACHHAVGGHALPASARTPGVPPLDLGSAAAYGILLAGIDAAAARDVASGAAALQDAAARRAPDVAARATALRTRVDATIAEVAGWTPDAAALRALLARLSVPSAAPARVPYTTAEQLFFGVQATLVTAKRSGSLPAGRLHAARRATGRLYDAVRSHEAYDPVAFGAAQTALAAALAARDDR